MISVAGRRLSYGWVVIGSVALLMMASSGTRFGLGVIFKPMVDHFGVSRGEMSLAVTLNVMIAGLSQPFIGMLVDRYGSKVVSAAGMLLTAAALLGTSLAHDVWQVYLLYGMAAAVGFAAAGPASTAKLVAQWFVKRRAFAMSLSSTGTMLGQFVVIPALALITLHSSWAWAFRFLALVIIGITFPAWLLLVRPPKLHERAAGLQREGENFRLPLRCALSGAPFWQLGFGYLVCGFTMSFTATHLIAFADDHHIPQVTASTAVAMMSAIGLVASIIMGWLSERTGRKNMLAFVYMLRGLSFVLLLFVQSERDLFLVAVVLGASWLSTVPLTATITADLYGSSSMGTIYGFLFALMPVGSAIGSSAGGFIYDLTGTYTGALWLSASLGFLASLAVLLVRTEPVPEVQRARAGLAGIGQQTAGIR